MTGQRTLKRRIILLFPFPRSRPDMDLGISGKRAVVIGGSDGLGLACCKALAAGADLALFARNRSRLDTVATELAPVHTIRAEGFAGDITKRTDVRNLAVWLARTGGVDILIVNTPRPPSPMRDFLDETEDDRWDDAYRKQLYGALSVLRSVTPLLLGKGWGR